MNGTVIGFAFDGMRHIQKAQVVQPAADRWLIRIVPGVGYTDADGQRVLDKLAAEVSSRVAARIELVDTIPALPSGKYKWVVREYRGDPPVPDTPGLHARCAHAHARSGGSRLMLSELTMDQLARAPAVTVELVRSRDQWDSLLAQVSLPHFPQAWVYGEGKRSQGWTR